MGRVIRFDSRRRRAAAFVEMNADEDRFRLVIRDDGAVRKRNVTVVSAGQSDHEAALSQDALDAMREIESQILFHHPVFDRPGILSAVAGIENYHRKRRRWGRSRFEAGYGSWNGRDLEPNERAGHEQQANPRQKRAFARP